MAELTREAFLDIQARLAKETSDKEDRRQQEIKESNSRLNKNLNDLGDKLAKAVKDGDKDLEEFLNDQITATNRQISDNELQSLLKEFNFFNEGGYDLDFTINNKILSSGQLQKISFMRSLLNNTQLLLLDESTSNIDSVIIAPCKDKKIPSTLMSFI